MTPKNLTSISGKPLGKEQQNIGYVIYLMLKSNYIDFTEKGKVADSTKFACQKNTQGQR